MSDVLRRICEDKRADVDGRKRHRSLSELFEGARSASAPRGFRAALQQARDGGRFGLIAEIKKASPSRGLIRADFDPPSLARAYRAGGASCLSILTEERWFQGSDGYLVAARNAVDLPVLRKDFFLDPYQVVEARALGADCILLIMAALEDAAAEELEAAALDLGMDVLVEVHDRAELERALRLKSSLIGINNRNLKSLKVDLATTEELAPHVPGDRLLVCESGLRSTEDLLRMQRCGAGCFLVGEHLMSQPDVQTATTELLGGQAPAAA